MEEEEEDNQLNSEPFNTKLLFFKTIYVSERERERKEEEEEDFKFNRSCNKRINFNLISEQSNIQEYTEEGKQKMCTCLFYLFVY